MSRGKTIDGRIGSRVLHTAGWILSIGLLIWFVHHSLMDTNILYLLPWDTKLVASLLVPVPLYVATLIIGTLVWWRQLLNLQDFPISSYRVLAIGLCSQFAKYLPGNVAHHIGRVVLAKRSGISVTAIVFSILLETFWVLAIAVSLAVTSMLVFGGNLSTYRITAMGILLLALAIFAAVATPHLLLHRQWNSISRRYLSRHGVSHQPLHNPSWRVALLSLSGYLLSYLLIGLMISSLGWLIFSAPLHNILMLGSAFALAWVIGFVTPGSPAGLGIREVILLQSLTPIYGSETATGIVVLLRLLTIGGDALGYLLGLWFWRVADSNSKRTQT